MKKVCLLFLAVLAVATSLMSARSAAATFNPNLIMDDEVFDNSGSMSASQIDTFLNTFPNSCISPNSGFRAIEPTGYTPSGGYTYGGYVTAGQVISVASSVYGLNPQVLLATLQKEQSLVAGASGSFCTSGTENKYTGAVGYGCPDSGNSYNYTGLSLYQRNGVTVSNTGNTCVNSAAKAGFSQQLIRAAWLLKFAKERSEGNVGWAVIKGSWDNSDDLPVCYSGPMTQGTLKRCSSGAAAPYDGYLTIDNTKTHMDTGATAAFYWYTPHFAGNTSLVNIFTAWFGGTIGASYYACRGATNIPNTTDNAKVIVNNYSGRFDGLSVAMLNGTGSACAELHTWADGNYQSWAQHTATNLAATNPADSEIIPARVAGKDMLVLVQYRNTGSGKIELHGWDASAQHWAMHVATNVSAIDPADARVITADTNADGTDEYYFVKYQNTGSGKVEVHGWSKDFQGWTSHIATNHPAVSTTDTRILSANPNGGADSFFMVKYQNTGSGKIELHGWSPDMQGWTSHIATNVIATPLSQANVLNADTNGDGRTEFQFVVYKNTGSGKLEVHGWSPDMQGWTSHIATSIGGF